MNSLYWLRMARRFSFLPKNPEYAHLETLLETEADRPHDLYRILSWVFPPIAAVLGIGMGLAAFLSGIPWLAIGTAFFFALGAALWVIFDRLDKSIPRSLARIRRSADAILQRYAGFSNILGLGAAVSPAVSSIADQAAAVYLKHCSDNARTTGTPFAGARQNALEAIEEAMARILEMAAEPTIGSQELELSRGWAQPLLQEMIKLDQALDRQSASEMIGQGFAHRDALSNLRDARIELEGIDSATTELEERA